MNNTSKLELLGTILSLINGESYQATITNLAKDCNVPILYMRKVLIALLSNRIIGKCMYTREEREQENELTITEQFTDDPSRVSRLIMRGDFDDIRFDITLNLLNQDASELLTLSHTDFYALGALGESASSLQRFSLFEKKDNTNPVSSDIRKLQDTLITAANNEQAVNFTYTNSNGEVNQVTCFPYEIITNVTDNWIYLRAANGKHYRLDRIEPGCSPIRLGAERPAPNINESEKYKWGVFGDTDIPEHVKVVIFIDNEDKLIRITNDLKYRKETYKLTDKGDYYLYEDDVIGIDEFQRWIRSYGPSVVVLEPESQKDQIIERAQKTLDLYDNSKAWSSL